MVLFIQMYSLLVFCSDRSDPYFILYIHPPCLFHLKFSRKDTYIGKRDVHFTYTGTTRAQTFAHSSDAIGAMFRRRDGRVLQKRACARGQRACVVAILLLSRVEVDGEKVISCHV